MIKCTAGRTWKFKQTHRCKILPARNLFSVNISLWKRKDEYEVNILAWIPLKILVEFKTGSFIHTEYSFLALHVFRYFG